MEVIERSTCCNFQSGEPQHHVDGDLILPIRLIDHISNNVHMRSTFASVSTCGRPIGLGAFFRANKRLTEDKVRPTAEAMSVRDIPCSKCIWRTIDFSAMLMRGVLLANGMVYQLGGRNGLNMHLEPVNTSRMQHNCLKT